MITAFTEITVKAINLKDWWKIVFDNPFIHSCTTPIFHLFSMFLSIIVNVVESQKKRFGFAATSTTIATITSDGFVLKTMIIIHAMIIMFLSICFIPLTGTLNIFFTVILLIILSNPIFGSCSPLSVIFSPAFFTDKAVKSFGGSCVTAFFTSLRLLHNFISLVITIIDYENHVNRKAQRLFRKEVEPSGSKRPTPRNGDDIVRSWQKCQAVV